LISGCRSDQTSADAYIGGEFQGAATYSLLKTLGNNGYDCTYKELVEGMNDFMYDNKFTQRPELNGSEALFSTKAFAEPFVAPGVVDNYEPVDLPPAPSTTQQPISLPVFADGVVRLVAIMIATVLAVVGWIFIVR
jgi:hypothetical protein